MSESPSASSSAVKRACDACHRRKVKCIPGSGARACKNCHQSGLECTYNAIPQKKGPKGSRAKVISELRETQRHTHAAPSASVKSSAVRGSPVIISPEIIASAVEYFFANLYPTQPVLQKQKVTDMIALVGTDVEAYCMIITLCAYVMIQSSMEVSPSALASLHIRPQSPPEYGQVLLNEAIRARKGLDYIENPSTWSVITSFFIFGCYFCLDRQNAALYYLREATTLAQTCRMHEEASYTSVEPSESSRRRCLYWLLFITERAYALQRHRPLSLHDTIALPTLEDPAESLELSGFLHLVNLFRVVDDVFVNLWNKSGTGATAEFVARLQQQLSEALPTYLQSTEIQAVDLRCSQQWLRMMVWQLSIRHGFLSSTAPQEALSFNFPVEVSRELIAAATQFSKHSMEVHGIGLIEKIFDVACTLADVISCVPYEQRPLEFGPKDYLNQLVTLISQLRGGQQRYIPLLLSKINDTMPRSASFGLSTHSGTSAAPSMYVHRGPSGATDSKPFNPFGDTSIRPHTEPVEAYRGEAMIVSTSDTAAFRDSTTSTAGFAGLESHAALYSHSDSAIYSDGIGHSDSDVTGEEDDSTE